MNPITKSVSIIHRMTNAILKKELASYGLGSGQYIYLLHLYQKDGVNQDDLTRKMMMDKGTTAKALKKLEELEYIKRDRDSDDKRVMRVFLTEKGTEIKHDIYKTLDELNKMLESGLEHEEKYMLEKLLDKVSNNMLEGHGCVCGCFKSEKTEEQI